eukprot:GEMP01005474.1.p1 GENE.GEMP01005474.1~~GEMP01005474.1.p1  ORF type:complete len:1041 (+),score=289.39 GEMP01005474.1:46-3168(+)
MDLPRGPGRPLERIRDPPELRALPTYAVEATVRLGASGLRRTSSAARQLPRLSPPVSPPDSAKSTARLIAAYGPNDSPRSFSSNVETPKVKWIPHTHTNPRHAKFCYMCLHGALEGKKEEEIVTLEDDLPSSLELRNRGYLHPKQFLRLGADFQKNNIVAAWLRSLVKENYVRSTEMVLEMNQQIEKESIGTGYGTSYLEYEDEEQNDWNIVTKIFQLSAAEQRELEEQKENLANWCNRVPLQNAEPIPNPPNTLPVLEFEVPSAVQNLRYEPVLDMRTFSAETLALVDSVCDSTRMSFGNNFITQVPAPSPLRHLGDIELIVKPLDADIPELPEVVLPSPERPIIQAVGDPIPKPFFYIHTFEEKGMPEFTVPIGEMADLPPSYCDRPLLVSKLHPEVGKADNPMVPLLDHPYWPPVELVAEGSGFGAKKRVVTRGIWDPELISTSGRRMPPLVDRVQALKFDLEYEHIDAKHATDMYVELKGSAEIVEELIPIINVKSMARFPPKPLSVEFPEFLRMLVNVDWTNQTVFGVLDQRHEVVIKEAQRAERERRMREIEKEQMQEMFARGAMKDLPEESVVAATAPADEVVAATAQAAPLPALDAGDPQPPAGPEGTAAPDAALPLAVSEGPQAAVEGAPAPKAALAPSSPPAEDEDEETPPPLIAAPSVPDGAAVVRSESVAGAPATPAVHSGEEDTDRPAASSSIPAHLLTSSRGALVTHQQRLQALLEDERRDMQIEHLLTQDAFISRLAEKISTRMEVSDVKARAAPRGVDGWHMGMEYTRPSGDLTTHYTASGNAMTELAAPLPLVFTDDDTVAAQRGGLLDLPKALRGEDPAAPRLKDGTDAPPKDVIKEYTMEKSRGNCYVRLLIEVDPEGSKKAIVPILPEIHEPDDSLILQQQFQMREPIKPGSDETIFEDVELSSVVLFSFVRHNRFEAVQELLEQDMELLRASDDNGNSLLHVACQNNHRRTAKLLIKLGINVNVQNKTGNTPLHYCYAFRFSQLADILLQSNADSAIPNFAGLLPAKGIGQTEAAQDDE